MNHYYDSPSLYYIEGTDGCSEGQLGHGDVVPRRKPTRVAVKRKHAESSSTWDDEDAEGEEIRVVDVSYGAFAYVGKYASQE